MVVAILKIFYFRENQLLK